MAPTKSDPIKTKSSTLAGRGKAESARYSSVAGSKARTVWDSPYQHNLAVDRDWSRTLHHFRELRHQGPPVRPGVVPPNLVIGAHRILRPGLVAAAKGVEGLPNRHDPLRPAGLPRKRARTFHEAARLRVSSDHRVVQAVRLVQQVPFGVERFEFPRSP